jgi:response regulator RpfG family c-di-GMP phosphodiesterase
MSDPKFAEPIAIHVEAPIAGPIISRSSRARFNEARDALLETKRQLLNDMTHQRFELSEQTLQALSHLRDIQDEADAFAQRLSQGTTDDFTRADIETMRAMKREGKTEARIAELYDTNQTKVNRLVNSSKV